MAHRRVLAWLEDPDAQHGIKFARRAGEWETWSYAELAVAVRTLASGLVALGVDRGDRVVIVLRGGADFVTALFGVMAAGAVPCPVAPPMLFQDGTTYASHLSGVLAATEPAVIVTAPDFVDRLAVLAPFAKMTTAADLIGHGDPDAIPVVRAPEDGALLQFTSGSSGAARGVRVTFDALEANIHAIRHWLGMTAADVTATWLPVHHDMGLIGCVLTPVVNGSDVWVLQPERFLRDPLRYLRCFGEAGATLTAMPVFGLEYIARRVQPASLEGLDFSAWRGLIVGAERIYPSALERFEALLAPFGFRSRAFLPAYGLAEATLAVTGLALEDQWRAVVADPRPVALGAAVWPTAEGGQAAVGCGRPLAGVQLEMVDEDGESLKEGHLGQIVVRGLSVAAGYVGLRHSASQTTISAGTVHTGDAGFVLDGELFVVGRLGDSMKVRGRTVFAEDIEAALIDAGIPRSRVAVLLGSSPAGARAVILLERAEDSWLALAASVLRRTAEGAKASVLAVPSRTIERTTSGKPKRRLLWRALVDGRLAGVNLPDAPVRT